MKNPSVTAVAIFGLTLLVPATLEPPSRRELPASIGAKRHELSTPYDSPFAAWRFERDKRASAMVRAKAAPLYRRAERHRRRLRTYSTALGRFIEPARRSDRAKTDRAKAGVAGEWESLGPGNIGGRTRALVINYERPRIMYAGGVSGGVWKSIDSGTSWRPEGDELTNLAINSLAMDPSDPDTLYAGTGEGYFREVVRETSLPLRGGGIFKSSDAGASWTQLEGTRGRRFHWVNDLVVSRHDPGRIYAATRKGVLRTVDGGRKWKRVLRPKRTQGGCLDLVARTDAAGDSLLASCGTLSSGAVYRKTDAQNAGKWERVLAEEGQGRTSLAIAPSNEDVVYALASSTVPGPGGAFLQALHGVFRSDHGGAAQTWVATVRNTDQRKINTLILSNPVIAFVEECGFDGLNENFAMGWYTNVIAVDPGDPNRVWAGGVDLLRSDDGGRNWNPVTYWWEDDGRLSAVHADQHGLVFHPRKPATLYSLNDGGIYRTANAGAAIASDDLAVCRPDAPAVGWQSLNNNYGATQFYHGTVFPDGGTYLGGAQDNGTNLGSDALGSNGWRGILGGDGGYSAVDPTNPTILYATTQNGRIYKSVNGGASFEQRTNGIVDLATNNANDFRAVGDNFLFIAPLIMDPSNSQRLWSAGIRLWRTGDGAQSWQAASAVLAGRGSALAISAADPDRVLVGTEEGSIHRSSTATTSGGATEWVSSRPRGGFVSSVAFDISNPMTTYATYAGFGGEHVWRSVDGGATWVSIDGDGAAGVPEIPVHAIAVDPADGERLYLGTDLGVLVSVDGGETWAAENTGFASAVTESLAIVEAGDGNRNLFAFTHGRGAWRVELE